MHTQVPSKYFLISRASSVHTRFTLKSTKYSTNNYLVIGCKLFSPPLYKSLLLHITYYILGLHIININVTMK